MLRRIVKIVGIVLGVLALLIAVLVVVVIVSPNGRLVLPVEHKPQFEPTAGAEVSLRVRGNELVDAEGHVVRLRGLMPRDPASLDSRGLFNRDFYAQVAATEANAVRIAVHPESWVHDPDYLWRHLDPIAGWAGELGMYMIVDWHYIGNIVSGTGDEMPDIEEPPRELTLEFWNQVSAYFRDAPNVVFEIWNEPAGGIAAQTWQRSAAEIVQAIRAQGAKQPIIVGGIDYSRDLSWVLENPIQDDNIVYAAHIYPAHSRSQWDHWFGQVSQVYPVLATEWGFMDENRAEGPSYLAGSRSGYGEPFLEYLDAHGIGWIACWYDDDWKPPMYTKGWNAPTEYGNFVLEELETAQEQARAEGQ
jgi:hypothetical protein